MFPTMANVNHSCDPNFTIVNFLGSQAVAFANRTIEKGEELHDTYGAVFYHMDKGERQHYLKVSRNIYCAVYVVQWLMVFFDCLTGVSLVQLYLQSMLRELAVVPALAKGLLEAKRVSLQVQAVQPEGASTRR